jgi:hypothetical protein
MIDSFAALLGGHDEAEMVRSFATKQRFHLSLPPSDRAEPLLPWESLEQLIASDVLAHDRLVLRRAGGDYPRHLYRTRGGTGSIDPGALNKQLAQGASIVLDGIDKWQPQITALAAALERRLGGKCWANAYLTFGTGGAFPPHYDSHDVIVVQIRGRKLWRSFGAMTPYPIASPPAYGAIPDPEWEAWLEPGQVLYMPRGEIHAAEAAEGVSVHVSFGISAPRGLDVFKHLRREAERSETFRMDLPRFATPEERAAHEARLRAELHALVDGLSIEDVLRRDDGEARAHRPLMLPSGVPMTVASLLVPTPRRRLPTGAPDEEGVVIVEREAIPLSARARALLAALLERDRAPLAEMSGALPGIDEAELIEAAQELQRKGLVQIRG